MEFTETNRAECICCRHMIRQHSLGQSVMFKHPHPELDVCVIMGTYIVSSCQCGGLYYESRCIGNIDLDDVTITPR